MANPILCASFVAGSVTTLVGFLTWSGVVLSLTSSRKESKRDRQHAADEAHKERLATMRREVYLSGVEELIKAQNYLGTLPKQDFTNKNLFEGLLGLQIAVSKIGIVAEQDTALKARALAGRYSSFMMKSLHIMMPLMIAKSERDTADTNHTDSRAEVKRVLVQMGAFVESGIRDDGQLERLNNAFQMHQDWAKKHSEARDIANLKINEAEMDYVKVLRAESGTLASELDEIACLIRKELGVETDMSRFVAQTKDLQEKLNAVFDEVMAMWNQAHEAHVRRVDEAGDASQ
ncbi:hypothetical protein AX768_13470 [Burkholderia sp. PAMC 28687]|nr:hypothetical protein AX768_13470 [Burkholderia sp. PAMC 28687]